MNKIVLSAFAALLVGVLFVQSAEQTKAQAPDPLPELPSAGLTPSSPFYFFERAAEAIGDFLTFDTKAKAKLQAERALERIAEVKAMLAQKEVDPKGLDVALDKLQANAAKAAGIIQAEQQKGNDVSKLAKELDTDFEVRERLLKRTLEEKEGQLKLAFKQQKLELKRQLLGAKTAGDTQKVSEIGLALDKLEQEKEAQESLLSKEEEELELALEREEEKFELAMEEKERDLELKEKEAKLAFEKKKRELKRQFKEAKLALELKEEALESQFDVALELGESEDIENARAQLLAIGDETSSLDSKFDESDRALDEVEREFELLLLKDERALEDFVRHEELALKKAEFETKLAFKERELAQESQFRAEEGALKIIEKRLKVQIRQVQQTCRQAANSAACITEKVGPLQEKLAQVKIQKEELELEEEKAEQALELEEEKIEQELELKEKKLELREEERERALEKKEEEFERLQEKTERQLEQQEEEEDAVEREIINQDNTIGDDLEARNINEAEKEQAPQPKEVEMRSGNFFFSKESLTVQKDQPVKITFQNTGKHTFTIDELGVNAPLRSSSAIVEFTPSKSGTFEYYCAVPGHRERGMLGSFAVE